MKLHIGCGKKFLEGYTHVDIMKYDHIDYIADIKDLSIFEDNSINEIYISHVLEHINRNEIESVLKGLYRILKNKSSSNIKGGGGILRIAVPDFDAIVQEYLNTNNLDLLLGLLYGGQNYEYNYHYQTYNFSRLETLLKRASFQNIYRYDWKEFLPHDYDDFSRAYSPHLDFENGRLMSLNVIAEK